MRRPVIAAVVAAALVAGGGAAWGWQERTRAAVEAADADRVASAVAAGVHDEQSAADLADRSAGLVGQDVLAASLATLSQAVPTAQAVLDGSAGKVADDAVRQQLAAVIAQAQAAVAGSAAPAQADELVGTLSSASAAVTAAQQAWEADQAAKAAAAARTSASASAAATPKQLDSCKTTYNGPPFYTSVPTADGDGSNGKIPASQMTEMTWAGKDPKGNGYWLITAAAEALTRLNTAFEAQFGHHLDLDLTYRDLKTQQEMYAALGPKIAAYPGKSTHGWGKAIDVPELPCEYGLNTPQRDWLVEHGPEYGWYPISSEYWHFNYEP